MKKNVKAKTQRRHGIVELLKLAEANPVVDAMLNSISEDTFLDACNGDRREMERRRQRMANDPGFLRAMQTHVKKTKARTG
jgi:hypothetical protein